VAIVKFSLAEGGDGRKDEREELKAVAAHQILSSLQLGRGN